MSALSERECAVAVGRAPCVIVPQVAQLNKACHITTASCWDVSWECQSKMVYKIVDANTGMTVLPEGMYPGGINCLVFEGDCQSVPRWVKMKLQISITHGESCVDLQGVRCAAGLLTCAVANTYADEDPECTGNPTGTMGVQLCGCTPSGPKSTQSGAALEALAACR